MISAPDSDEDHFSDASEGHSNLQTRSPQSGRASPIPVTRVERIDDSAHHGEIPGTIAYEKRIQDAVPDEIEVLSSDISEGQSNRQAELPQSGRASPIPITRVERVDDSAQYGEMPGTDAFQKRTQDAVPDEIEVVPSNASEGQSNLQTELPQSGRTSPIPLTRVERVDNNALHGEIPGTDAYEKRIQDAVPDEIEVVPDNTKSRNPSPAGSQDRPLTPGGSEIPRTVVEKIDPEAPSHGEVPGTEAYDKRRADAVPDIVARVSPDEKTRDLTEATKEESDTLNAGHQPIPETRVSRVDTIPAEDQSQTQTKAHQRSPSDALPDTVETITDDAPSTAMGAEDDFIDPGTDDEFGDDFDEFVDDQGGMDDNDDFGGFDDFDDDFQEPEVPGHLTDAGNAFPQQPPASISVVRDAKYSINADS